MRVSNKMSLHFLIELSDFCGVNDCEITCLFDATSVDRVCLKPLLPDPLERPYRTCIALRN